MVRLATGWPIRARARLLSVPLGLASSWDEELYHEVYTEVAAEARSRGLQEVLAPVLDITRDPRWGRTDETMGEDGYLNGALASPR